MFDLSKNEDRVKLIAALSVGLALLLAYMVQSKRSEEDFVMCGAEEFSMCGAEEEFGYYEESDD